MKEARSFVFPLVGGHDGELLRTVDVFLAEEREVMQYRVARPTIQISRRRTQKGKGRKVTLYSIFNQDVLHRRSIIR